MRCSYFLASSLASEGNHITISTNKIVFCYLLSFGYAGHLKCVLRITHENIFNGYSKFQIDLSFPQPTSPQNCPADQTVHLLRYMFLHITEALRAWSQVEMSGSSLKSRSLTWWFMSHLMILFFGKLEIFL